MCSRTVIVAIASYVIVMAVPWHHSAFRVVLAPLVAVAITYIYVTCNSRGACHVTRESVLHFMQWVGVIWIPLPLGSVLQVHVALCGYTNGVVPRGAQMAVFVMISCGIEIAGAIIASLLVSRNVDVSVSKPLRYGTVASSLALQVLGILMAYVIASAGRDVLFEAVVF